MKREQLYRAPGEWVPTVRNPRPALGPDILTLSQLRYYIGEFLTNPDYGICHITGGTAAFRRWVAGDDGALWSALYHRITARKTEYLPRHQQVHLSRKVWQVLRGQVIFVPERKGRATFKPTFDRPQPPIPDLLPRPDHQFRLDMTCIGPKIRRL